MEHYISIDRKSFVDSNVGKRQYLSTLLSMNTREKVIKLFKENQGLLGTAEVIRLALLHKSFNQQQKLSKQALTKPPRLP